MRVIIIGGGASGMMAAITAAANPKHTVILLERQARVGRKLAATGNGRCNLTNLHLADGDYQTDAPAILDRLNAFDVEKTLAFFQSLGLVTVAEPSGRVYPFSDQANSVVDVLRFALDKPNIQLVTGCEVTAVRRRDGRFQVQTTGQTFSAERLILACGGPAGGKLGGTDDGFRFAQSLGHRLIDPRPGLVQLKCTAPSLRGLKGIRAETELTLLDNGRRVCQLTGEVQFTDYGVSGPAIFTLSRDIARLVQPVLRLNLLPQLDGASLLTMLRQRAATCPALTADNLLTGMLQNRLGRTIIQQAGLRPDTPLRQLTDEQLDAVVRAVHFWTLPIDGTLGFDQAQVTIGGIPAGEFDPVTLESRRCPGLFACGEVLNVDGTCGGFNLQWAWSSGHTAGLLGQEDRP
jgi:predicted Rossmann fold flavoprotein